MKLKEFLKEFNINENQILDKQAGVIPIFDPKIKSQKDNIFLVGDAAGQVKATTGGGIIQGLIAAKCLHDAIIYDNDYSNVWRQKIGKELLAHLIARKIMNKFKFKDWNELVKLCNQKKIKKLLYEEERDNFISLAIKMVLKEPKFLKFAKFLI